LKYSTCQLVPVMASNYKQHILSPDKVSKICYSLAELHTKSVYLNLFGWRGAFSGVQAIKFWKPLAYTLGSKPPVQSYIRSRDSSVSLTADWTTGRSRFDPGRGKRIFPLASVCRPALGPTQPPVQWLPGVLSLGVKGGAWR
jgi:hypothetical protein